MKYNHLEIEPKWQKHWKENKTFRTPEFEELDKTKPKHYVLDMFPYPSGDGLHVGHPEGYTATDIIARYKIMQGYNVLHPMGWDAFGLPTEQFALKTGIHPRIRTAECIARFRHQLEALGFAYDWDRQISTSDKSFFKWTQWIFLKLFNSYYDDNENRAKPIELLDVPDHFIGNAREEFINNHRLAYLADGPVNWSPELGTVLANEEVAEQEEKGFTVVRKNMKQWKLRITKYAERLLNDLNKIDWPENIKEIQRNWIGRSEGAIIDFNIKGSEDKHITVFTTRPDTIFGATYMVLAPEHELVKQITVDSKLAEVESYIDEAAKKSELERMEMVKDKTGVFTGAYAINPANEKEIPILISDYVLAGYGTGAIMAVPGHDERDNEFARKFKLEIVPVVVPEELKDFAIKKIKDEKVGEIIIAGKGVSRLNGEDSNVLTDYLTRVKTGEECFSGEGYSIKSGIITGLKTSEAKEKITGWLEEKGVGKRSINYKLRDWLFSRQRYWGEPFPVIHTEDGSIKPLSEDDLPLELPDVESYKPSGTGESPLANITEWLNVTDKETGLNARRETNTMPQLAGSSWYFLRYIDPSNNNEIVNKQKEEYWMPVDIYIGGSEHAVGHLLYSRFWQKFLYDLGYVSHDEPFKKLFNQGMILGEDGLKMSKSKGNVINPDTVIEEFGADSMRLFEMFLGPLEASKPWSTEGIGGINRFINRVWRLIIDEETGNLKSNITDSPQDDKLTKMLHRTIKKVTNDMDDGDMKFNTSIAQMMMFVNDAYKTESLNKEVIKQFILLLAPFAPHISEELWQKLGGQPSVNSQMWPSYDEALAKSDVVTIAFSVNGKLRATQEFDADADEEVLKEAAKANDKVRKFTEGKEIIKVITVKNRMVNIVVKDKQLQ